MTGLSKAQRERYSRHLLLPEIGEAGQRRLLDASVLVVGAGGLGSPVLLYLAAAGVGRLSVVDGDAVELCNLQRQIIHDSGDVGRPKASSAAEALHALNPEVEVEVIEGWVNAANAVALFARFDLVCDCTDRFASRTLIHDAAYFARRPLVTASIFRFEGQLATFRGWEPGQPCYRCLYPEQTPSELVPPASRSGVMGAPVGVMGALVATEAVKELLGIGVGMSGRLLLYDALFCEFRVVAVAKDPSCALCGPKPRITALSDSEAAAGEI